MSANSTCVAASLFMILLTCGQAWCDEPATVSDKPSQPPRGFIGRIHDRWVRRTQGTQQPATTARPSGTTQPTTPEPNPAAAQPGTPSQTPSSPQPGTPTQAPSSAVPSVAPIPGSTPAAAPIQPGPGLTPPAGSTALTTQPLAAAAAEPFEEEEAPIRDVRSYRGSNPLPMIGDMAPVTLGRPLVPGPPPSPPPHGSSVFYPSVRTFKISENQSPRPQDRIFFDFNYWSNLNAAVNQAARVPITNINAYRYLFGVEKTFDDGRGSIGIRLPLDSVTAQSNVLITPTSTALDNLSVFAKYILEENRQTGSLLSVGLAVTPPTGPNRFAVRRGFSASTRSISSPSSATSTTGIAGTSRASAGSVFRRTRMTLC